MKKLMIILIFVGSAFLLSACGNEEEEFTVLFFTEELNEKIDEEEIEKQILEQMPEIDEENFSLVFHVSMLEKLFMEIAAHQGDLLIVDEHLLDAAANPDGIHQLDDIAPISIKGSMEEPYLQKNPETGEEELYVLPINNDTTVIQELGLELEHQVGGFIPVYADNEELSKKVLEFLVKQD
ncbi:hypothetical protein CR203_13715 [Salipaludibacillus neizhouensis]|uniref:Lipoprotein YteS n=1 Tax=Salipaludibacillus neizhouensis TaxID=885475 RepID=A0A3A9K911_9BACI|nr:hypothetical protein [Salipaludibacillus neizhouensis]RKL66881.1 hypothetical protein CR203_13715 [Salipaludibacillus neizhouensis]